MQDNAPNGKRLLLSLKFFAVLLAIITIANCMPAGNLEKNNAATVSFLFILIPFFFHYHCRCMHFSPILAFVDFPCRSKIAESSDHDIFPVDSRLLFVLPDNGRIHSQRYRPKYGTATGRKTTG